MDFIDKEKAIRAFQGGVASRLLRHFIAWPIVVAACALAYFAYVVAGVSASAPQRGRLSGLDVRASTSIYRDERDFPHIRARTRHDAFFAEGFVQGSDRLFQMDLFRRYVYGELAQVFGPNQLAGDETMRTLDPRAVVDRQWAHLAPADRAVLQAFSDGVNAAMRAQRLPIEFRLLLYAPQPWTPRDCLAVTLAISATLGDSPENVLARDALWRSVRHAQYAQVLPLSDPDYDVTARGAENHAPVARARVAWVAGRRIAPPALGSNAWAAGATRTVNGHALIANDPHLLLSIPGIWYVVEMRAPGLHVAGVTVPGVPGVVLGHNDRIAWATTNAIVSTLSVFQPGRLRARDWKREVFHVRFAHDVVKEYYRSAREFGVPAGTMQGIALVRWTPYVDSRSALSTVLALDRAASIRDALNALARYAGPPQNFVIAGSNGRIAYHLAGPIPNDPAWGRYVHPASDLAKRFAAIPFDALPSVAPSRGAVVVSANNKMYARGYPYRLSAMFAPPYRAYRIASLLHARTRYDAAYFARMQLDSFSPADAEFAHRLASYGRAHPGFLPRSVVAGLARWNGAYSAESRTATLEHRLRATAESSAISPYAAFDALRSREPPRQLIDALDGASIDAPSDSQPWGSAGAVRLLHPFGPLGFAFLDAGPFPGDGDEYTVHMQTAELSQSFRAVWETQNWDAGGMSIPAGESGEVGSRHYDDLRAAWIRGDLQPLPFSDTAVARATRNRLLLTP